MSAIVKVLQQPIKLATSERTVTRVAIRSQGLRGREGPAGDVVALEGYTHTQSSPSSSWTVNHNLGRKPLVQVLSPGGLEVIAEVLHVSTNQVLVSFASAQSGSVRCL
jgi:hypothetical protein